MLACMLGFDHTGPHSSSWCVPKGRLTNPPFKSCLPAAPHIQYCCNAHACRSDSASVAGGIPHESRRLAAPMDRVVCLAESPCCHLWTLPSRTWQRFQPHACLLAAHSVLPSINAVIPGAVLITCCCCAFTALRVASVTGRVRGGRARSRTSTCLTRLFC
jgi:hypothetical protein